jgi:CDP-glucose 4,6-dehydratase
MTIPSFKAAYAGKRVVVTGHSGFKGTWLSLWLRSLGAEVFGISLDRPSDPAMADLVGLDHVVPGRRVDVRQAAPLAAALAEAAPEVVFHLAAQPLVRLSYEDPLATFDTNVMGVANVLDACRRIPSVRAVVVVTSDKCYQNNEWYWGYREIDPMGGYDPYSASKGCAELVTRSFTQSFFPAEAFGRTHHVAVASGRAGNAIGGGDFGLARLIPDCIRAFSVGRVVQIRYPDSVRPWQHAMECLSGYLQLGAGLLQDGPKYGGGWNFAPLPTGETWGVRRVVDAIASLWGSGGCEPEPGDHPHEARMLRLDCSKAISDLGWTPRWPVASALAATVRWYRAWHDGAGPEALRALTLEQIQEYEQTIP